MGYRQFNNSLVDWEKVTTVVNPHFERIESRVSVFLAGHPEWDGEAKLENFPPRIELKFFLRPEARRKRRVVWPENTGLPRPCASFIKSEEAIVPADFAAALEKEVPDLKVKRDFLSRDCSYMLEYHFKPDYNRFLKGKT